MARPLTILCQSFKGLIDEVNIVLIDIEAQQPQASSCWTTNAVQKHECFTNKIVVGFVLLSTQIILKKRIALY